MEVQNFQILMKNVGNGPAGDRFYYHLLSSVMTLGIFHLKKKQKNHENQHE